MTSSYVPGLNESLIHTIKIYSQDIGMSFRQDKCGRMVIRRGRVVRTEEIVLPEGKITDVKHSYKYLEIPKLDKWRNAAIVIDVAIPSNSNIRKKETEKLKKYQGLKVELEMMWKVNAQVVPVVIGTLCRTPKLPGPTRDCPNPIFI